MSDFPVPPGRPPAQRPPGGIIPGRPPVDKVPPKEPPDRLPPIGRPPADKVPNFPVPPGRPPASDKPPLGGGGGGDNGGGGGGGGGGGPVTPTPQHTQMALDLIRSVFPWAETLGLVDTIATWVMEGLTNPDELLGRLRQTTQYRDRFGGIFRPDGTIRMSESQYLSTEDSYRSLLRQYGFGDEFFDQPGDYLSFFENEINPEELGQRLDLYDNLRRGSNAIRSAFWVYAGIRLTDDDLYNYVVDPSRRNRFDEQYEIEVSRQDLTYNTYIERVAALGLDEALRDLRNMRDSGVDVSAAASQLQNMHPDQARQLADALHMASRSTPAGELSLNDLLTSYQYALLGSAATEQGFALPDVVKLQSYVDAGVSRNQALQTYGQYAAQGASFDAMVRRARGEAFTVEDYTDAALLANGEEMRNLERGLAQERGRSAAQGAFAFGTDRSGRLVQPGFGNYSRN